MFLEQIRSWLWLLQIIWWNRWCDAHMNHLRKTNIDKINPRNVESNQLELLQVKLLLVILVVLVAIVVVFLSKNCHCEPWISLDECDLVIGILELVFKVNVIFFYFFKVNVGCAYLDSLIFFWHHIMLKTITRAITFYSRPWAFKLWTICLSWTFYVSTQN